MSDQPSDRLARTLRSLLATRTSDLADTAQPDAVGDTAADRARTTSNATVADDAPPFHAASFEELASRLAVVEREVQETRTRVNALFFAALATAVGNVFGRVVL